MPFQNFEEALTGGHPNSLGNTIEVVENVLASPDRFDNLFNCYFSSDEVVRLRVSNAMKRICKVRPDLLMLYMDRFLKEISGINQASTQWTLADLFAQLEKKLSPEQRLAAVEIMKRNVANHHDWIVLNQTMKTLGQWAKKDSELASWLKPHLQRLAQDERKSVSKTATKTLQLIP